MLRSIAMPKKEVIELVMNTKDKVSSAIEPIVKNFAFDNAARALHEKNGNTLWYLKGVSVGVEEVLTTALSFYISKECAGQPRDELESYIDEVCTALAAGLAYKLKKAVPALMDNLESEGGN